MTRLEPRRGRSQARRGAEPRAAPDVVVRYGSTSEQGSATVGYTGIRSTVMLAHGLGSAAASALAAHELGHVLGLGHETHACSVMTPVIEIGAASDVQDRHLPGAPPLPRPDRRRRRPAGALRASPGG